VAEKLCQPISFKQMFARTEAKDEEAIERADVIQVQEPDVKVRYPRWEVWVLPQLFGVCELQLFQRKPDLDRSVAVLNANRALARPGTRGCGL